MSFQFLSKKIHAYALRHENTQMPVHEVFVHHFRLPRRGEEMAHFLFLKAKQPGQERPGFAG